MGGDFAPAAPVEGALRAHRELGLDVLLVGHRDRVRGALRDLGAPDALPIHHAPEVVAMGDPPHAPIRRLVGASIRLALELLKSRDVSAVVTSGHTGAAVTTAYFLLGPLPGVDRPAIATRLPTLAGMSVLLDVGAYLSCKPFHLLQFAVMGRAYAQAILERDDPSVGLLSIGEEEGKGNALTREAYKLLRASALRFTGNVDARDVFRGLADVLVCEGFVGNVALKLGEGLAGTIHTLLERETSRDFLSRLGSRLLRPALRRVHALLDETEYGGGPLLGVRGVVVIAHGRASGKAIKNAIRVAAQCAEHSLPQRVADSLPAFGVVSPPKTVEASPGRLEGQP